MTEFDHVDRGSWRRETSDRDATIAKLIAERDRLKAALKDISTRSCPVYVAHPQSVWWEIHVKDIARAALSEPAGGEKL